MSTRLPSDLEIDDTGTRPGAVQREACGLARHERVIETYEIPGAVLAKVGAIRPRRAEG